MDGVIDPVVLEMERPAVDEYVPPGVPVRFTPCAVVTVRQNGLPAYEMEAEGGVVIVTDVVVETAAQPPLAAKAYVTVYVLAMEVDGVISPVVELIVNPPPAEKVPPAVPTMVTGCAVETDLQNGVPAYEIVADGNPVMVTEAVTVPAAHPADAG